MGEAVVEVSRTPGLLVTATPASTSALRCVKRSQMDVRYSVCQRISERGSPCVRSFFLSCSSYNIWVPHLGVISCEESEQGKAWSAVLLPGGTACVLFLGQSLGRSGMGLLYCISASRGTPGWTRKKIELAELWRAGWQIRRRMKIRQNEPSVGVLIGERPVFPALDTRK